MASADISVGAPANYRWGATLNHIWLDSLRGGKAAIGISSVTLNSGSDQVFFYTKSSSYGPPPQLVLTLSPAPAPSLTIDAATLDASFGSINVPVNFTSNGASISSLAFSLDYDAACLSIDDTDGDSDGIPDAVSGFPGGYVPIVTHNGGASTLEIGIADHLEPLDALPAELSIATIVFDVVSNCPATNISFSTDPATSFGNTDGDPVSGTTTAGALTLTYNSPPTDISLFADAGLTVPFAGIDENFAGPTIAYFDTTDADSGDLHTYTLVAGTGDTDNAVFTISGNELEAPAFDFETKTSYAIRVQTDDGNGGVFEKQFLITVNNVNEAPTAIGPVDMYVDENQPSGTVINLLITDDPDFDDSHTYSITGGNTTALALNGDTLETAASLNFEEQASYIITVRTTDSGGLFYEADLTITVNDLNDAPVAVDDLIDPLTLVAVGPTTLDVLANDTDEDAGALLYIESVSSANAAIIDLVDVDDGIQYTPPAGNGTESFTYVATDSLLSSNPATVDITYVADDLRGDCNGNGGVDAGDLSAIALEYFDTDSSTNWYEIYQQGYLGSPIGCDANASQNGADPINAPTLSVDVSDIICTVFVFFGNDACTTGSVLAANATTPVRLSVANVNAAAGDTVQLPISLTTNGNAIAAAGFTIAYDAAALAFDNTDADGDGIPDALTLDLPQGVQAWVQTGEGVIQIAVAGISLPLPTLDDGDLATVTFSVTKTGGAAALRDASVGNANGVSVSVITHDGAVGEVSTDFFLPLVVR